MYHVSAQGVDERMMNVHYYYYYDVAGKTSLDKVQQHFKLKNSAVSLYQHLASQVGVFQIPLLRIMWQPWLWNSQLSNTFKSLAENTHFPNFSK